MVFPKSEENPSPTELAPLQTKTERLISQGRNSYFPVYSPREMIVSHGEGARLWDLEGREYIDLGTGIGVNALGHQEPDLLQAAKNQLDKIWHTSNIYFTEPVVSLASELIASTFADRVFFSNSGAEANEAAIKIARKFCSLRSSLQSTVSPKREILTFKGSFHGRTLTTATATAQAKFHEGFEPLPAGFTYCPFNDFEKAEKLITAHTCAVLLEPIQGESGIIAAAPGFLQHLQSLCHQHEALLIFDEIQSGMGRTGRFFAYEWEEGVRPDIVTIAKSLGGGLPLGAMLTTERVARVFKFGDHGSTFGGNPIAAAVARVVLQKIRNPLLMEQVIIRGEQFKIRLQALHHTFGIFKQIRGKGLMIGAELQGPWQGQARELTEACRKHGVLILQAGPNTLRFLPPLNITEEELQTGMDRMAFTLKTIASQKGL